MFAEVDDDGSGEIEFEEFIQIMTNVNEKLGDDNSPAAADEDKPPEEESERPLPFPMMAMAYKRRKLMEAAFDPEVRALSGLCRCPDALLSRRVLLGCEVRLSWR